MTEEKLKKWVEDNLQFGEHIRFGGKSPHSLVFIAVSDTGFYTLQYYGDSRTPFLSHSTWEYFTDFPFVFQRFYQFIKLLQHLFIKSIDCAVNRKHT